MFLYILVIEIKEGFNMTKINYKDRLLMEKAIYYPLLLSVLEYDRKVKEVSNFKIKTVYLNLIENTMNLVQRELKKVNDQLRKGNMKVQRELNDGLFTEYNFYHKGYFEVHRYYNANLRNNTERLLGEFLHKGRES